MSWCTENIQEYILHSLNCTHSFKADANLSAVWFLLSIYVLLYCLNHHSYITTHLCNRFPRNFQASMELQADLLYVSSVRAVHWSDMSCLLVKVVRKQNCFIPAPKQQHESQQWMQCGNTGIMTEFCSCKIALGDFKPRRSIATLRQQKQFYHMIQAASEMACSKQVELEDRLPRGTLWGADVPSLQSTKFSWLLKQKSF